MREIKFRVWDNKVMTYPKTIEIGINGYTGETACSFQLDMGGYCTTGYVMQYTGLKDKNGKEIYEGDILRCTSNFVSLETGEPTGKICVETYQVIYIEQKASFTTQTIKGQYPVGYINGLGIDQEWMDKYYEVIGNVWENPELVSNA